MDKFEAIEIFIKRIKDAFQDPDFKVTGYSFDKKTYSRLKTEEVKFSIGKSDFSLSIIEPQEKST